MDNTRVKNSVGIWAFGPNATRFVPSGYHPETINEDMVTRTRRVVDGLADLMDGLEYHYPGEINEENVEAIKAALGSMDIYCLYRRSGTQDRPQGSCRGSFACGCCRGL